MSSRWPDLRKFVVCSVLLLLTIVLYWPVLTYDFVDYDDPSYVVQNSHINKGFRWSQIPWFFQARYVGNWHPLTWLSHALDCQIYGLWAGGHHLTNVMLHALSAVVLFLLLQRFTKAFWRSAFVAALFAWHPLHVESVAWISERKDCLSCLLWMLTLWAYLRYAENLKSQISHFKFCYWLAIVFFALALMAKPMVVTLPFVLFLLDFWPLARTHSVPARALVKEKIPFFLLSAACCVLTVMAQGRGGAVVPLQTVPMASRFWNAAISYLWYMQKAFWPSGLMVVYPLGGLARGLIALAMILIVLIFVLAVLWRQTRPYFLLFGWCWYLGTLVPVIGLLQVGSQTRADRYFYIPSIGVFIIMAWGVNNFAAKWPYRRVILSILASAAVIVCLTATRIQLAFWQDTETLFSHALKVMPDNYVVWECYASYLLDQNRFEEARWDCERALRISPGNGVVENILGEVLLAEKKSDQAADRFRLCLRSLPKNEGARMNLGHILLATNRPGEAIVEFQAALRLDPDNEEIHFSLGEALALQGNAEEAGKEFAECIRLKSDEAKPHARLAGLLSGQGRTVEAISQYRQAMSLQPDSPDALNNLAWILAVDSHAELRDGKEAVRLAVKACDLTHNTKPLMIGTLAAAYAEAGRFDEAVAAAQKAHDLALAIGKKEIAAKNFELMQLYRSHRPYHEKL